MYKFILVMLLIIVGVHKSIADTGETGELGCSKYRIIRLSVGESWEPYYSETLPNGGVVTEIVRRAFEISCYQIQVTWLPWARAINLAKYGTYDGLIGAWYTKERTQYFAYSKPFLATELVVIKRKGESVIYKKTSDLKAYRIGVALDSAPHELLKAEMEQNLEIGISAYANIQKLMAKRFDLLVDEKLNIFYIVNTHFPEWLNAIEVLSPPLQVNYLHLIISKENGEYQVLIDAFNKGLDEITKNGTFESILAEYNFISDLQHGIE